MTRAPLSPVVLLLSLAACSSTVGSLSASPAPDVSEVTDAAPAAGEDVASASCLLPDGQRCARGASCPAGDGCNTCACYGPGPLATCTTRGCAAPDAGAPDRCAGATISPDGRGCVGPAGGALPLECCTWNCDVRLSPCDSLPPVCPAGLAVTVAPGCWGPCVPPGACAPMSCASDRPCLAPWRCDASSGRCVFGG